MKGVGWLLLLVSAGAAAGPLSPFHAGAELGVLMREEAGGQRTPSPALVLRGSWGRLGPAELSAVYQFAFSVEGAAVRAFSQHHRLHLRPELFLELGAGALSASAGPGVALTYSRYWAEGPDFSTTYPRLLLGGELAFSVQLGRTRLRTGVDVTYGENGRVDLLISVGAGFGWGGGQ